MLTTGQHLEGGAAIRIRGRGRAVAPGAVIGVRRLRLRARAGADGQFGYAVLRPAPPSLSSYGSLWFLRAHEGLAISGAAHGLPVGSVRELLALQATRRALYEGNAHAVDTVVFGEQVGATLQVLIAEGLVLSEDLQVSYTELVRIVSRLVLGGQASGLAEALGQILDALVLVAAAQSLQKADLADTLVLASQLDALYAAIATALERLVLSGTAGGVQLAHALVAERLVLAADLSHEADLAVLVREAVGFMATLSLDTGEYIAWTLNTESKGLTRYTQYPFNSFACIGGRYYGAAADGLHRLDGDDDNGTPIAARIRLGLSALGTRKLKRMPEAFIGYAGSGALLLRVITIDEQTGEKAAAIYRLRPRGAACTREARFKMGRGLKSVDWDFEIENVDGADFDLTAIQFRPLVLDRRTRG
jgi:hypothetical protein